MIRPVYVPFSLKDKYGDMAGERKFSSGSGDPCSESKCITRMTARRYHVHNAVAEVLYSLQVLMLRLVYAVFAE